MDTKVEDRVAVVTGGSRGIGAGLARAFHARGLKVAVCARGEPAPGALPDDEERVFFGRADVTDHASLDSFARAARERLGSIDLWVNNAGLLEPVCMLREADPLAFARHLAVNVTGVFHGTRIFLRLCHEESRAGALVNIGSGAAVSPYQGWGAYCAGKAAVDMLTRVTALEEARHGMRVFALAPGVIETGMQELIRRKSAGEFPDVQRFRDMAASGALLDPESPAPAILRLAFGPPLPESEVILDVRTSPALRDL